jgi:hypothetical protein
MAEVNHAIRAKVAESEQAEEDGRKEVPSCDFNIQASIRGLSPRYASLTDDTDFDCRGAHPSEDQAVKVTSWVRAEPDWWTSTTGAQVAAQLGRLDGRFPVLAGGLARAHS